MQVFEQKFEEGMLIGEHYVVHHHTPEKPLYERIYEAFKEDEGLPWGGVQVKDTLDGWCGWHRVWPINSD
jgi:hypothetical protein